MSDGRTFSDEELTCYLDGEADAALHAAVDAARVHNGDVKARLEHLTLDEAALKSAFDGLLDGAPAAPELPGTRPAVSQGFGASALRSMAATAVVCLMLGGWAGAWLATPGEASWREFAAAYHALYVKRTLAEINNPRVASEHELERVSEALGKKIELAAVTKVERLDYKRAQILGFKGQPLIQLAFLSKGGAPVALCIIREANGGSRAIAMREMHAMSSASWSKDGYSYFLVGGSDAALIEKAAADFAARL